MADNDSAPFAFAGLDRVFHERARLGIVTSLAGQRDGVAFTDLKRLCDLTDGNLARHLQAIEEAGLAEAVRSTGKGRPVTRYRLTPHGRERFLAYLSALEDALREAAVAMRGDTELPPRPASA